MLEEAPTLFNPFRLSHFLNDRTCSRILVAKKKKKKRGRTAKLVLASTYPAFRVSIFITDSARYIAIKHAIYQKFALLSKHFPNASTI